MCVYMYKCVYKHGCNIYIYAYIHIDKLKSGMAITVVSHLLARFTLYL